MKFVNIYLAFIACITTLTSCLWADNDFAPTNQRLELRGTKFSFVLAVDSKGEFATPSWKSSFKIFQTPDTQNPVFTDSTTNGLQQFDLQSKTSRVVGLEGADVLVASYILGTDGLDPDFLNMVIVYNGRPFKNQAELKKLDDGNMVVGMPSFDKAMSADLRKLAEEQWVKVSKSWKSNSN
jgi:hypothetical protein